MGKSLSYIIAIVISFFFIARSSAIKTDDRALKSGPDLMYGACHGNDHTGREADSRVKFSSSDDSKEFILSRFGGGAHGSRVLTEKQHFVLESFLCIFPATSSGKPSSIAFWSYNTHVSDLLRRLLYPKHSFW